MNLKYLTLIISVASLGTAFASEAPENDPRDHNQQIKPQDQYFKSSSHCPASNVLRNVMRVHMNDIKENKPFKFIHNGQQITVSNFTKNRDISHEDAINMPLVYNARGPQDQTWCYAQFLERDLVMLAANLTIAPIPPIPSLTDMAIDKVKGYNKENKISQEDIDTLPQDIKDKMDPKGVNKN